MSRFDKTVSKSAATHVIKNSDRIRFDTMLHIVFKTDLFFTIILPMFVFYEARASDMPRIRSCRTAESPKRGLPVAALTESESVVGAFSDSF